MEKKIEMTSIEVVPKKHSIRYNFDPVSGITSIYISLDVLEKLGDPKRVKVTIEAAP